MTVASIIPGLTTDQNKNVLSILASVLEPQQNVCVWVFGSRAKGVFRPYSDVDLLIESESDALFTANQVQRALIMLDDSELPYKFDLVRSEDLVEAFRADIIRQRQFITKLSRSCS